MIRSATKIKMTVIFLLFMVAIGFAQDGETSDNSYDPFHHYSTAMKVLIGYGGLSMAAGAPMMFSDDPWMKRIGTQNLLWGAVDAGIGVYALVAQERNRDNVSRQEKIDSFRRTMVINGLLDVAYITTGILLTRFTDNVRLKATGVGFVIQGSFLLGFDWVNYGLTFR
ncbi:MAG: hypothetical protein GF401_01710 [Chitinivibrionales bacterium]|nr:hypothetical protein [Chitinivibrionales bacterium]